MGGVSTDTGDADKTIENDKKTDTEKTTDTDTKTNTDTKTGTDTTTGIDTKTNTDTKTGTDTKTDTDNKTDTKVEPSVEKFTVTYVSSKATAPEAFTADDGTALTAAQLPTLSAEGFKFLGWYSEDTQIKAGDKITKTLTLTAKWIAQYTVSYTSAYATAPEAFTVDDGTTLTAAQLPSLTESGFTFGGWFDGTTKVEAGYEVTKTLTLTAKWEEKLVPLVLWNGIYNWRGVYNEYESLLTVETDEDEEEGTITTYYFETQDDETKSFSPEGLFIFNEKNVSSASALATGAKGKYKASPVYCFSDDCVYVANESKILGYKIDGTEIVNCYEFDMTGSFANSKITNLLYYEDTLYFITNITDSEVYFCAVKIGDEENTFASLQLYSIPFAAIYKNDTKLIILIPDANKLFSREIEYNADEKKLSVNGRKQILDASSYNIDTINDVMIKGNDCYILASLDIRLWSDYNEKRSFEYFPIYYFDDEDGNKKQISGTCGGILKLDLSTGELKKWKNGEYVLGQNIYKGPYYKWNKITDDECELKLSEESKDISLPPALSQSDQYFYRPLRFIAKKPDELIIADDGGYIELERDPISTKKAVKAYKNVNRIVTVNLKDESMTATDVDYSFSSTIRNGSGYYEF